METLASLALAAATLDGSKRTSNNQPSRIATMPPNGHPTTITAGPPPATMIPRLPSRQGFARDLRVVSSDSMTEEDHSSSSSSPSASVVPVATFNRATPPQETTTRDEEVVPSDPDSMEGLILLQTLDVPHGSNNRSPPPPSPSEVISEVKEDDVLCGRGGETNHHPGNIRYRVLVKKYQLLYLRAKRRDKPKIARLIVDTIRRRYGRFLKKDVETNTWRDVGNNKAREKTSQALREGAPELRNGQPPKNKNGSGDSKKRKREATMTATVGSSSPQAAPVAIVSPTPSLSPGAVRPIVHATTPTPTHIPTVPTYDEEDDHSDSTQPASPATKKQSRGPRLKILKSRLMCEATLE